MKEVTLEQLAQMMIAKELKDTLAQERAAQAQAEAAAAARVQAEAFRVQALALARIEVDLASIKSDIILIRNKVVSDFGGMSAQTKEDIETQFNTVGEITEEDLFQGERQVVVQTKNGQVLKVVKTAPRRAVVSQLFKSYSPDATRGQLTSCGNWVSSIIYKISGLQFKGKYPERLVGPIESLVAYYAVERDSKRMY